MNHNNATLRTTTSYAILIALLGALLTSCSPVLHTAVGHNVPLLREKGEARFGGGYAETDVASGASLQIATAIDSSLAICALFHSLSSSNSSDEWSGSGTYIDVMMGKFGNFSNGRFVWEVFAGLGYCAMKNEYVGDYVNAKYVKPYVQPSIGIVGKIAEFALTPRIGLVNYTSQSYNLSDIQLRNAVDEFFDEKGTTFVFEPGVTLRVGYKSVKIQAQYSYTTFSFNNAEWDPVEADFLSIGIDFLIPDRFVKK
ncbi:MAG TPA: hypothetical protein VKZ75_03375 [Cyclobacteriaceae bacterium]|nr:hypothetical protein [Cyclobacteriaceae bacterium]